MTISVQYFSRRALLRGAAGGMAGVTIGALDRASASAAEPANLAAETFAFVRRCARGDGGYAPSPDAEYKGYSDTSLSDLAGVTYAATLAKTMGWQLPQPGRSIEFIHRHQQPDGAFLSQGGSRDPKSNLSVLYSTVQAVVALRALGERPRIDPFKVMDRFFVDKAYQKLPWYATSFFPLFYATLGKPFPEQYDRALRDLQVRNQKDDGYLGDHVAATFHTAHYFRLVGQPTPKAAQMVQRVLHDQRPDGGWNIKEPDWDVHACFDAVFILRQLGGKSEAVRRDPESRRLGPRLPQRGRRLRPLSWAALRHGRRLLPVRYADPGRAPAGREARPARRPYAKLGPRHAARQGVLIIFIRSSYPDLSVLRVLTDIFLSSFFFLKGAHLPWPERLPFPAPDRRDAVWLAASPCRIVKELNTVSIRYSLYANQLIPGEANCLKISWEVTPGPVGRLAR